jgi:hypothetical protein
LVLRAEAVELEVEIEVESLKIAGRSPVPGAALQSE